MALKHERTDRKIRNRAPRARERGNHHLRTAVVPLGSTVLHALTYTT